MNRSRIILFLSVIMTVIMLGGCAETDDLGFSESDLAGFIADDEADITDAAGDTDSTDTDPGYADEESASDDTVTPVPEDDTRIEYIGGLTREEYDALTLAEQDKLRDAERAKVTPAYESDILPEYRELYDYNNAVIGYIYIDGTVIDAPVLQTLADYEYYLHRDIDGNVSEPGCIILDADSEIGIGTAEGGYLEGYAPTTIQLVHGHNMRNGTMFGSLLKYADEGYADRHSTIQYDSLYEHRTYEVIEAFYSQIYPEDSDDFKYYTYNQLDTETEYDHWRENIDNMALYIRDVDAGWGDEFIVLSTCAYQTEDGRFAVVGVRTYE